MRAENIQAELHRLQLHPVNLDASEGENHSVLLRGSLLAHSTCHESSTANGFSRYCRACRTEQGRKRRWTPFMPLTPVRPHAQSEQRRSRVYTRHLRNRLP